MCYIRLSLVIGGVEGGPGSYLTHRSVLQKYKEAITDVFGHFFYKFYMLYFNYNVGQYYEMQNKLYYSCSL